MNRILYIALVSLMLTGCFEREVDAVVSRNGVTYAINEDNPYTGKLIIYWDKNGQKQTESNYKDGKKNGLVTHFHENGQKRFEGNYKDGDRNGLSTVWYVSGKKEYEDNYKDGVKLN